MVAALSLIMRSPHATAQLANGGQELEQKMQAVVFARLDDENIDVRKVRPICIFDAWGDGSFLTSFIHRALGCRSRCRDMDNLQEERRRCKRNLIGCCDLH